MQVFIADKIAEIGKLQISLTGLLENLEAQVQIAINFFGAKEDQSERDRSMNDLATFLSTEANGLQLEGVNWTNRLKYRMRELEEQSNRIQAFTLRTSPRSSSAGDPDTESYSSTRQSSDNKVRLPQLEVPTFDGSYKEYPTFWTIFNSLIRSIGA
ncbi:unnamed protein product [Cylicostephanus goldi]|uniref:Uncharacterized protein n=1 Tax=Cylicostephanus goldi TaxID=71465 RepID=A0A3P7NNR8_CYLGO|nr:unnamed protein product [Cylicostephanus goldi]